MNFLKERIIMNKFLLNVRESDFHISSSDYSKIYIFRWLLGGKMRQAFHH
jgi:hypothetical protein